MRTQAGIRIVEDDVAERAREERRSRFVFFTIAYVAHLVGAVIPNVENIPVAIRKNHQGSNCA